MQAVYTILASLDLGLLVGLIRFVSDARERQETDAIQQTASTAFFCLGAMGLVISALIFTGGRMVSSLFDLPVEASSLAAKALGIASLGLGLELASFVLASYLQANHEFHLPNATETVVRLLRAAAMAVLVLRGYGLMAIVAVFPLSAAIRLLGNLAMSRLSRYPFFPSLRAVRLPSLRGLDRKSVV